LAVAVFNDKANVLFLDKPRWEKRRAVIGVAQINNYLSQIKAIDRYFTLRLILIKTN
jgi:hypothetical protein